MNSKNRFIEYDDYMLGITSDGAVFIFDKEDFDLIKEKTWSHDSGTKKIYTTFKGKQVTLWRYLLNNPDSMIDHINGFRKDNRRCNLRLVNASQNAKNNISNNKYGVNGIRKTKAGKYDVRINISGKEIYLGTFNELQEAVYMRILAEKNFLREYAPTRRYLTI